MAVLSDKPSWIPRNCYQKIRRRDATSVFAGYHDPRPLRDALTTVLNGVPRNREAERRGIEDGRRGPLPAQAPPPAEKQPVVVKKPRGRPPKVRPALPAQPVAASASAPPAIPAPKPSLLPIPVPDTPLPPPPALPTLDPSIYGTRPHVHLPQDHRSRSFSPPNIGLPSRPSTPGPSVSSSTTRVSSKRPHTPDDGFLEPAFRDQSSSTPEPTDDTKRPPRKKRNTAARKGWKGWVEISEDEEEQSAKLISSEPKILSVEKRTRSGRIVG